MKRLRKSHSVTMPDALIAATAAANKMTLITGNTRHFPLKDLKTKKPTNLF
jgi:predicted nucleic acid-binding protein